MLLESLQRKGIDGEILRWLKSWLTNRTMQTRVKGDLSTKKITKSSVPQGSGLSPILFAIFLDDIVKEISEDTEAVFYADDIRLYRTAKTLEDWSTLQRDLDIMDKWNDEHSMLFSPAKCEIITYGRPAKDDEPGLFMKGVRLAEKSTIKDLGVWTDDDMKYRTHFDTVVSRIRSTAVRLKTLRPTRKAKILNLIWDALVVSRILHGANVWNVQKSKDLSRLVQAQASFFSGVEYKKGDKIAPFITQTLIKLDMVMYWKMLNDKTPLDKREFFNAHNGEWLVDTRLSREEDRTLRVDSNVRMQLNRNRDFTRRRIDMWNKFPPKIRTGSEYTLKTFLKEEYEVTKTCLLYTSPSPRD